MSTPSLRSPKSPPKQWLSNDEQSSAARRSKEHVASEQVVSLSAVTDGGAIERSEKAPPMNYPIDENLFHSAPSQPLVENATADQDDVNDTAYQEVAAEGIPHPADFKPFFTLVEDPVSGEHHHPTVHYIFSDDDPEILTNAALEALEADGKDSQQEIPADHVEERFVIVDMAADGKTVMSASSLSRDWQAIQTTVSAAPSWGDDAKSEDKGHMLKISGQESSQINGARDKRKASGNIDELIAAFSERLDRLDEVLGRQQDLTEELRALD